MKKIAILIISTITFWLFLGLGILIITTNAIAFDFEINGLYPKASITTISKYDDEYNYSNYYYSSNYKPKNIEIINNTNSELKITVDEIRYPQDKFDNFYDMEIYSYNNLDLSYKNEVLTVNNINPSHDLYYVNNLFFASNLDSPLKLHIYSIENVNSDNYEDYDKYEKITSNDETTSTTINIPKGGTYETAFSK